MCFPDVVRVAQRLRRKGELKIRDLAVCIGRYAGACFSATGLRLSDDAAFEDLDDVVNELDHCLYTIRVLDRDVFEASNKQAYDKLRKANDEGGVVTGLRAVRDAATHHADVTEPNLVRALGPLPPGRFIVFERWRYRRELPPKRFKNVDGKVVAERAEAFDRHVGGRYVLDTLFDAFRFFDIADPKLVARDAEGQIRGFPIPPLELVAGYYRIHPDWPTHEVVERRLRTRAEEDLPAGERREIVGTVGGGSTVVGWTQEAGSRSAFTETVEQACADIRRGYPYITLLEGVERPIRAKRSSLFVDEAALVDVLPDVSEEGEYPWSHWADLAAGDATIYRRQRRS